MADLPDFEPMDVEIVSEEEMAAFQAEADRHTTDIEATLDLLTGVPPTGDHELKVAGDNPLIRKRPFHKGLSAAAVQRPTGTGRGSGFWANEAKDGQSPLIRAATSGAGGVPEDVAGEAMNIDEYRRGYRSIQERARDLDDNKRLALEEIAKRSPAMSMALGFTGRPSDEQVDDFASWMGTDVVVRNGNPRLVDKANISLSSHPASRFEDIDQQRAAALWLDTFGLDFEEDQIDDLLGQLVEQGLATSNGVGEDGSPRWRLTAEGNAGADAILSALWAEDARVRDVISYAEPPGLVFVCNSEHRIAGFASWVAR